MLSEVRTHLVRVVHHLDNNYTTLEGVNDQGQRLLGYPTFDVPTQIIPFHLRPLGSRFLLRYRVIPLDIQGSMPVDQLREERSSMYEVIDPTAS